jgi:hypothetical protein
VTAILEWLPLDTLRSIVLDAFGREDDAPDDLDLPRLQPGLERC